MTVKVINREDESIYSVYHNVGSVKEVFSDNGILCHQIRMKDETATYPDCEWKFFKLDWVKMF